MVKLNKIYTKTGDDGSTGLADGSRVAKYDTRIHCMGDIDEANSMIGIARLYVEDEHAAMLAHVQNDMFDVGADVATPLPDKPARQALRVSPHQVARLEQEIDQMNGRLSPLTSFVLPGGQKSSAYLHQARAVTRRAERQLCALAAALPINQHALHYLNRLSDFLFVMARLENDCGSADVLWIPGENR